MLSHHLFLQGEDKTAPKIGDAIACSDGMYDIVTQTQLFYLTKLILTLATTRRL